MYTFEKGKKQEPHGVLTADLCWDEQVPPNGLVVYTGTIVTEDGKDRKLNLDFEPFKPINTSLYLCDNKFHTEALNELLESDSKYGLGMPLHHLIRFIVAETCNRCSRLLIGPGDQDESCLFVLNPVGVMDLVTAHVSGLKRGRALLQVWFHSDGW